MSKENAIKFGLIIFLFLGFIVFGVMINEIRLWHNSNYWKPHDAIVKTPVNEVVQHKNFSIKTRTILQYSYVYKGKYFTSRRLAFGPFDGYLGCENLGRGDKIIIYISENGKDSVYIRRFHIVNLFILISSIVFIAITLLGLCSRTGTANPAGGHPRRILQFKVPDKKKESESKLKKCLETPGK